MLPHVSSYLRLSLVAACVAGVTLLTAAPVDAQTAEVRYDRALAREHAARRQTSPSLSTLRSIATAYEAIVRRYPRSGYCDNALWQAAGVLQLAWDQSGQVRDRDKALALLEWLRKEYPHSSLVAQTGTRRTALNARRGMPAVAVATAAPEPARRETAPTRQPSVSSEPSPEPTAAAAPSTIEPPAASAPQPSSAKGPAVMVRGLSHTPIPRGDRLTVELSQETSFTTSPLTTDGFVHIMLPDAQAADAFVAAASSMQGTVLKSLHVDNTDDGLRVTVGVDNAVRASTFPLYGPDRLVFDFEVVSADARPIAPASSSPAAEIPVAEREPPASVPASSAAALSRATERPAAAVDAIAVASPAVPTTDDAGPSPAPPSTIRGDYSLARQLGLGVSRIVIDPGHGGADPGASANGVTESALVLDIALRLEKLLLEQPGVEVVLTRRSNAAVPLARRTAIANAEAADLFLSIHANSSPRKQTAGVETYVLNLATNKQAETVAARENASSDEPMSTLPQLVRAITANNKLAESRELASVVQASLVRRLGSRNSDFQDLGVKQAPFMVLIGAQMPSILAEVGFLSNRTEAGLIKQNAYKQQIAQALCDAILQYQGSLKKVTSVAATTAGR